PPSPPPPQPRGNPLAFIERELYLSQVDVSIDHKLPSTVFALCQPPSQSSHRPNHENQQQDHNRPPHSSPRADTGAAFLVSLSSWLLVALDLPLSVSTPSSTTVMIFRIPIFGVRPSSAIFGGFI